MTRRILVALDGSAASEAVLHEVERIALGGAGIHLLRVVPMFPFRMDATSPGVMAAHDQAMSYLGELRGRLPDVRGLDLIRTGDPADAILQAAMEFDVDLIAMGTQGRPSRATENVVQRALCPLLLRRPGPLAAHRTLRRILVPLDGFPESLKILPTVKALALRTGAEVVFLHVSEHALAPLLPDGAAAEPRVSEDPKETFQSLARSLGNSDLVFRQTVGGGDAVEEILDHAKMLDADLIAMTTEAGPESEKTIVGSAALAVAGLADRAVLLQKPGLQALLPKAWKFS
jgi:nucleotide-binding universal stress UspA family protein